MRCCQNSVKRIAFPPGYCTVRSVLCNNAVTCKVFIISVVDEWWNSCSRAIQSGLLLFIFQQKLKYRHPWRSLSVWPGALRTDKTFRRNVIFEQITEGQPSDHRYVCRKKKIYIYISSLRDRRMPLMHWWPTWSSSSVLKIMMRQIYGVDSFVIISKK
jgi:hypothetical protein